MVSWMDEQKIIYIKIDGWQEGRIKNMKNNQMDGWMEGYKNI